MCYLVIRNFGNSQAVITKFNSDFDFKDCYYFNAPRDSLSELTNCSIAPGHSRICTIDYNKITKPVTFDIEYLSGDKIYSDSFTVDLKAGIDMPVSKTATENKELRTISYELQEMLTKDL